MTKSPSNIFLRTNPHWEVKCDWVPRLLYPFTHWQALRWFPYLGYVKCCNKHGSAYIFSISCFHFLWVYTQKWSYWLLPHRFVSVQEIYTSPSSGGTNTTISSRRPLNRDNLSFQRLVQIPRLKSIMHAILLSTVIFPRVDMRPNLAEGNKEGGEFLYILLDMEWRSMLLQLTLAT